MLTGISGRRVLVTAAAAGIGREIAIAFHAAGASVFACDIDGAGLATLAAACAGLTTTRCDIALRADVARMMEHGIDALGGLDVLVNNAGIPGPTAPAEAVDLDAWEAVLRINLTGSFQVTQLAIPHLRRSNAGSIVFMSSVAGRFGYPHRTAYATTKWGLIGLMKTLAIELGPDAIRVNAILPGAVAGPRLDRVIAARAEQSGESLEAVTRAAFASQSIKAAVDPRDIAALAVFLASDQAKAISGAALPIDGDMQTA